ncbi:hypothetical protein CYLTODRAFT_418996 [Cylindrobasidium torrendii FP15055 ss-10]|uniref:C2H2-type domain-containing protein n=1 Tax=Cylindrobasidium torrendii FP15055 ss-10 TaxID=1314674 RepID=A0A0D7BP03_9AGAR|nr:hypothetical protein CYLTODRAFT_418996 [Cylindrobasidium torrendii FP15055 ss-10]
MAPIKKERMDTLVDINIQCDITKPPVDNNPTSKACPYPTCTFRAVRAWDLRTHSRAHTTSDALTCPHAGCAYRTLKREKLRQHQRHTYRGETLPVRVGRVYVSGSAERELEDACEDAYGRGAVSVPDMW